MTIYAPKLPLRVEKINVNFRGYMWRLLDADGNTIDEYTDDDELNQARLSYFAHCANELPRIQAELDKLLDEGENPEENY